MRQIPVFSLLLLLSTRLALWIADRRITVAASATDESSVGSSLLIREAPA